MIERLNIQLGPIGSCIDMRRADRHAARSRMMRRVFLETAHDVVAQRIAQRPFLDADKFT